MFYPSTTHLHSSITNKDETREYYLHLQESADVSYLLADMTKNDPVEIPTWVYLTIF